MDITISIIIPVYNRPHEIEELLLSFSNQTDKKFNMIIVEDGSTLTCEEIVDSYKSKININYYFKSNTGPGETRNFGVSKSESEFVIFIDSDCIVPNNYIEKVKEFLHQNNVDAFGGPDTDHPSFSTVQKAVNYAMTSYLTTGGIRGKIKSLEKYMPRSFNMGVTKIAFEKAGGFPLIRFANSKAAGEDIALSINLRKLGFNIGFIPDAVVYHKRRINLSLFFKQAYNFGLARWNLSKLYQGTLKPVHLLPSIFLISSLAMIIGAIFIHKIFILPLIMYAIIIFLDSAQSRKSLIIGFYSIIASFLQLVGYGWGFLNGIFWKPPLDA